MSGSSSTIRRGPSVPHPRQRQAHRQPQPAALRALRPEAAAVSLDHPARERKADPETRARRAAAAESVEDRLQPFRRQPRPGIDDLDHRHSRLGTAGDRDRCPAARVFGGVLEEPRADLAQPVRVAVHGHLRQHRHAPPRPRARAAAPCPPARPAPSRRAPPDRAPSSSWPALRPGDPEQVLDSPEQPQGTAVDRRKTGRRVASACAHPELRLAEDHRQRRPEFVTDVGEEAAALRVHARQPRRSHRSERGGPLRDRGVQPRPVARDACRRPPQPGQQQPELVVPARGRRRSARRRARRPPQSPAASRPKSGRSSPR